jgi:hypothetical protein
MLVEAARAAKEAVIREILADLSPHDLPPTLLEVTEGYTFVDPVEQRAM